MIPADRSTEPPLLELENVRKDFLVAQRHGTTKRAVLRAVDDVSLRVESNKTLGLVGESGSGKTTLAKLIVRLEEATAGNVRFGGSDVSALKGSDLKAFRRKVQFVFQDPYASLPVRMSIGRLMREPLAIHAIGDAESRTRRTVDLLKLVGLSESDIDHYPHELSGGQRQRVAIARALMLEPSLVVCDEPVSSLDVSIRAQILRLLRGLQLELGLTYVVISHDLRVVAYLCQETAVMYLGRVVEHGWSSEVMHHPAHPYTRLLIDSILAPGDAKRRARTRSRPGPIPSPIDRPRGCHFHPRCPLRETLTPTEAARCVEERPILDLAKNGTRSACHYSEKATLRPWRGGLSA